MALEKALEVLASPALVDLPHEPDLPIHSILYDALMSLQVPGVTAEELSRGEDQYLFHPTQLQSAQTIDVSAEALFGAAAQILARIRALSTSLPEQIFSAVDAAANDIDVQQRAVVYTIQRRRELEELDRIKQSAADAEDRLISIEDNWNAMRNVDGSDQLWDHFKELSASELKAADGFRLATVVSLLASILYTGALLVVAHIYDDTTEENETWQRLVLTLALIALAGYLGRESAHHRQAGRWSQLLAVQLRTIGDYTSPLAEDSRRELMTSLGARVFSAAPQKSERGADSVPMTDLLDHLERLMSLRERA